MAAEEDIVQTIRIEGESDFISVFSRIASAGKQAFGEVQSSLNTLGGAFNKVNADATKAYGAINSGAANADKALKDVEKSSDQLGQSIANTGRAIKNAFSGLGGTLVRELSSFGKFGSNFEGAAKSAYRFGTAIRETGSAVATFATRTAVGMVASIGGAVLAFRNLARAAMGASAAERSAARERTAAINSQKSDTNQLFNINQQTIEQQAALSRSYGQGKTSLEDYTTGLQELEAQRKISIQSALAQQASEDAARERAQKAQAKLRQDQAFDQVADKVGNQAASAFLRLGNAIDQVANKAKQTLGPVLAQIVNGISQAIEQNMPAIQKFLEEIRASILPLGTDIPTAFKEALPGIFEFIRGMVDGIKLIVTAVKGLLVFFNGIAAVINAVFGTKFTGAALLAATAIASMSGALGVLLPLLKLLFAGLSLLVGVIGFLPFLILAVVVAFTAWLYATGKLGAAWEWLKGVWAGLSGIVASSIATVTGLWDGFVKWWGELPAKISAGASKLWTAVATLANDAVETVKGYFTSMWTWVSGVFDRVLQKAKEVWEKVKKFFSAGAADAPAGGTGSIVAAAGGGHIKGPGTSTSDSIPALLSNNEFVQRAAAVRKYGVGFMRSVNNLTFPDDFVDRFAGGGLVGGSFAMSPVLRMADGGGVNGGPRNILNLSLDGEQFNGLRADDDTMGRLQKRAIKKSLSPRKPNWVT